MVNLGGRLSFNADNVKKRFERSKVQLRAGTGSAIKNLGRVAKGVAVRKAPQSTVSGAEAEEFAKARSRLLGTTVPPHQPGSTKASIKLFQNEGGRNQSTLKLLNPTSERRNFNLGVWMHQQTVSSVGLPGVDVTRPEDWIKSGDPKFMFRAQERVRSEGAEAILNELKDRLTLLT